MNAPSKIQRTAALFKSNRNQAVRIPKDMEFPENIKKVTIRREGNAIIIEPEGNFWDDFFARGPNLDYPERFPQGEHQERESFE
jgi:antitoxin VapB